jgi:hypothetical protein
MKVGHGVNVWAYNSKLFVLQYTYCMKTSPHYVMHRPDRWYLQCSAPPRAPFHIYMNSVLLAAANLY